MAKYRRGRLNDEVRDEMAVILAQSKTREYEAFLSNRSRCRPTSNSPGFTIHTCRATSKRSKKA